MNLLEHPEAQALLADAVIRPEQIRELDQRLEPFLQRYFPLFQRHEQRLNAHFLLQGKLAPLTRKTAEPIAHFFGLPREPLQDFLGSSPWDDRTLLAQMRQHVIEV